MLSIEKLNVSVGDKKILKDFNLKIGKGEVHAIMGPNGSGKSTLSYVLAGKSGYEVDGKILFKDENIIDLEADERAQKGIFLAFQYPIEIDSGLDIDALKIVADGVNALRSKNRSFLIITHYQRLLDYIKPDFVHVMVNGSIVKTGCSKLAQELDKIGYKEFQKAV